MPGAGSTFREVAAYAISIINMAIPVLAGLALVIFFIGIVRYVAKSADEKGKEHDKQLILWGLIALFVIFSIWGILRVLTNTLLGGVSGGNGQFLNSSNFDPWQGVR